VTVRSGQLRQVGWRLGGGSYLSSSDPRLHFGLGDAGRIDEVEIAWPSGRVDRYHNLAADREHFLTESGQK
jgi:hypothetical protein